MSATKKATRTMYMHTLDGQPAYYQPGGQVVFATPGRYARKGVKLVGSIAEIREQWKAGEVWRAKQGLTPSSRSHSYVRVEVPHV